MNMNGLHCHGFGQAAGTKQGALHTGSDGGTPDFAAMLRQKAQGSLSYSKHAAMRMKERGITVDNSLEQELTLAVEGARKKGAKDVAVIGSRDVFIVNVPNNVVVTIVSREDMKDKIFTNIDSAVLL